MKNNKLLSIILFQITVIIVLLLSPVEIYATRVGIAFCDYSKCPGGCGMVGGSCGSSGCECGCTGQGITWSETCPVPNS